MYYKDTEHFKSLSGYVIDGFWYPRVTKIVDIKSKPALFKFYAEAGFKQGEQVKNKSASEGTLVHEIAEKILVGEKPIIPSEIAPAIAGLINLLKMRKIEVLPEFVEKRIVNYEHRYAGTIDALAIIDGKLGVLDIKTSYAVFRDYNLQTSAYFEALKADLKELEKRWILRIDQHRTCLNCNAVLRSKGGRDKIRENGYSCQEHQWSDLKGNVELKEIPVSENDFKAFLGAKSLWEWENERWLKEVGYL